MKRLLTFLSWAALVLWAAIVLLFPNAFAALLGRGLTPGYVAGAQLAFSVTVILVIAVKKEVSFTVIRSPWTPVIATTLIAAAALSLAIAETVPAVFAAADAFSARATRGVGLLWVLGVVTFLLFLWSLLGLRKRMLAPVAQQPMAPTTPAMQATPTQEPTPVVPPEPAAPVQTARKTTRKAAKKTQARRRS